MYFTSYISVTCILITLLFRIGHINCDIDPLKNNKGCDKGRDGAALMCYICICKLCNTVLQFLGSSL